MRTYERIAKALEDLMTSALMGSQKREILMSIYNLVVERINELDDAEEL